MRNEFAKLKEEIRNKEDRRLTSKDISELFTKMKYFRIIDKLIRDPEFWMEDFNEKLKNSNKWPTDIRIYYRL